MVFRALEFKVSGSRGRLSPRLALQVLLSLFGLSGLEFTHRVLAAMHSGLFACRG